jgi:hypothetical protein
MLKIFWTDHINRYPSLLHFILNATSSTLAINVAAGSSKANREELNETLLSYSCPYRFSLKPGAREKKPAGNVCRQILWTPGFLLSLITTRWGAVDTSAGKVSTAAVDKLQRANLDMMDPIDPRPEARAMPANVTIRGGASTSENSEFAAMGAMLGLLGQPPPPPPPPAPPTSESLAPDAATDDPPELTETAPDDADELGLDTHASSDETEYVPATVIGTRDTALGSVHRLLELLIELHQPWIDDGPGGIERAKRAKAAAVCGRAWATAIRTHSGDTVGHYYMHVAFAHLEELVLKHGPLQHGNDEVLEKGNHTMKKFRDMSYRGGNSSADAAPIYQQRYRKVQEATDTEPAKWEEFTMIKPNQPASWESVFKMQIAAEELTARRPHELDAKSAKAEYAKFRKRERFDAVKDEVDTGLTKAKTGHLATVTDKD